MILEPLIIRLEPPPFNLIRLFSRVITSYVHNQKDDEGPGETVVRRMVKKVVRKTQKKLRRKIHNSGSRLKKQAV